jgi:predicted Holliday junction resolvase-like endonuclease
MNNKKQLLSTLIYIYIIILVFTILYFYYNNTNIDNFSQSLEVKNEYNKLVTQNMTNISDYILRNTDTKNNNNEVNSINKIRIKKLMNNSISKLSTMINNYISNI